MQETSYFNKYNYVKNQRKGSRFPGEQHGQGNFELGANFGYHSRGSADPRESLRKRRISKLTLTAHKVLPHPGTGSLSASVRFRKITYLLPKLRQFINQFLGFLPTQARIRNRFSITVFAHLLSTVLDITLDHQSLHQFMNIF